MAAVRFITAIKKARSFLGVSPDDRGCKDYSMKVGISIRATDGFTPVILLFPAPLLAKENYATL